MGPPQRRSAAAMPSGCWGLRASSGRREVCWHVRFLVSCAEILLVVGGTSWREDDAFRTRAGQRLRESRLLPTSPVRSASLPAAAALWRFRVGDLHASLRIWRLAQMTASAAGCLRTAVGA